MISIKSIMTKNVIAVSPNLPIYEALDLLMKHKISGMPVVDSNNHVVGILTEKDVLKILIDKNLHAKNKVSDYMSHEVISFSEDEDAINICKFFIKSHIRRVPILKDNKLVGIVSRRDLVSLILEAKSKISSFRYD